MAANQRCSARVYGPRADSWGCMRKATVERNGKWYCKVHDPEYKAAKESAWEKKRREQDAQRDEILKRGERLAKRIGGGYVFFNHRKPMSECAYEEALVVPFDVLERLIAERE